MISGRHGRGSNMEAIARGCADGRIDGQIVSVIANFPDSPALERAATLGLPTITIPSPGKSETAADLDLYGERLMSHLRNADVGLICLAGYIRKLPPSVVSAFAGRIMNMHNALLPAFGGKGMYGMNVHQAVIESGVRFSGCTVHFVDEDYDTGPIILQTVVPVEDDDTPEILGSRILAAEHQTFPEAVALFAANRLRIEKRRVRILKPNDV